MRSLAGWCLVFLPFLVGARHSQDAGVEQLFKDLDHAEELTRLEAFDKLSSSGDAKVVSRLKAVLTTQLDLWSRKAATERTRALGELVATRKKSFNASEFGARQKEALALLKPQTLDRMEVAVRELWSLFYFVAARADEDDKVALAGARSRELAQRLDALAGKGTRSAEEAFVLAQRLLDETASIQVLQPKDQKVMKDNQALRSKVSPEEYDLVLWTNRYRVLMGKNALLINQNLCAAARGHSNDMKEKNFFDHLSPVPGKRTPADRAAKQGAGYSAENIAEGGTTGEWAFWGWFRSGGHHENMLGVHNEIGVGVFDTFWTEMFCR